MTDPAPSKFAALRDGFAAARELILVVALLALLFTPATVRQVLNDAGIRSFAGVEFDEQTLDEVEQAGSRVSELEQQLARAQEQLQGMSRNRGGAPDLRLESISKLLADAQSKAALTNQNLTEAKDKQLDLWDRSGRPPRGSRERMPSEADARDNRQALASPNQPYQR